ncbi:hypothetical protein ANN_08340 [Periplaneta americana]|uniref:Uncharacterized protein n=1 Tax=Periplaneta americana TaxID=6978 RepID=A0ABQ8T159_PERAM|nr:hypothetical protein ANN_08340 [Periplaneta americana]
MSHVFIWRKEGHGGWDPMPSLYTIKNTEILVVVTDGRESFQWTRISAISYDEEWVKLIPSDPGHLVTRNECTSVLSVTQEKTRGKNVTFLTIAVDYYKHRSDKHPSIQDVSENEASNEYGNTTEAKETQNITYFLTYLLAFKEPGGSLPPSHKPAIGPKKGHLLRISGKRTKEETLEVLCTECSIVWGRKMDITTKRIEAFEMWIWRSGQTRIRNEAVLERVGEERIMLKLMKKRKINWLGHWLRRNCLLKDSLAGMVNGRRVRGRRRYQMIDNIKIYGSYEETKRKAENRKDLRKLGLQ